MAYTVLDSKNIDKKKNIYTFGGSGTKPERDDIAENSKLIDYSSGEKFYYDPSKAAGSKWQPDKEPSGGGSGGDSLPENFPAEGAGNANKFVGFDENGDYTAKDAPEEIPSITGKNGKILGVTLNQDDEEQSEWVDAKTPLVVSEFTPDPEDQTKLICNYTSQQLFDVMQQGRSVVGVIGGDGDPIVVLPFITAIQVTSTTVIFGIPDVEQQSIVPMERVLADPFWVEA